MLHTISSLYKWTKSPWFGLHCIYCFFCPILLYFPYFLDVAFYSWNALEKCSRGQTKSFSFPLYRSILLYIPFYPMLNLTLFYTPLAHSECYYRKRKGFGRWCVFGNGETPPLRFSVRPSKHPYQSIQHKPTNEPKTFPLHPNLLLDLTWHTSQPAILPWHHIQSPGLAKTPG